MRVRSTPQDLVSLAKRMGYLQLLRLGMVGLVLLSAALTPGLIHTSVRELAPLSGAYAALSAAAEVLRRKGGRRRLGALSLLLLVDGVYLAWVAQLTGGIESPLRFLVFVHVIAVSLLASYRSGLKLALWHSLLLIATFEAQVAGLIPSAANRSPGLAAFHVTALWVVAIVTALFSALNERELKRRRYDLELLAKTAAELQDVSAPSEVADVLLERVAESFRSRRALVVGLKEETLIALGAKGVELPASRPTKRDAVIATAWRDRQPILVRSLDRKRDPWLRKLLPDARNIAIFPMLSEGRPLGALILEHEGLPRIERRVVAAVEQLTAHAALALRNVWLLEQVKELAERDPLTGACNRRTFEREIARHLAHSERSGERLTLAMFDIDHFKRHNDRFGHQAGDDILRSVGAALDSASRSFDTVARYGGEEFAVILPGLAQEEALAAVERLRTAIAACGGRTSVTASAGLATYPTNAGDAESLIRSADEALYESKASGRDRSTRSRRRGGLRTVGFRRRAS